MNEEKEFHIIVLNVNSAFYVKIFYLHSFGFYDCVSGCEIFQTEFEASSKINLLKDSGVDLSSTDDRVAGFTKLDGKFEKVEILKLNSEELKKIESDELIKEIIK